MAVKTAGVPSTPGLNTEGILHGRPILSHQVKSCQPHSPSDCCLPSTSPGGACLLHLSCTPADVLGHPRRDKHGQASLWPGIKSSHALSICDVPGIRTALALDPLDLAELSGFSFHSHPLKHTQPDFTEASRSQRRPVGTPPTHARQGSGSAVPWAPCAGPVAGRLCGTQSSVA